MPFNNEGLWTPDETIGQAPLAGLEMGNVEQSLVNFRQAQAAKKEQALLEMLKAGKDSGVDVSASPTSQSFTNTMGLQPGESSGLFHQLPQQKFLDSYNAMSDEDKADPDKVGQAAMAAGATEAPWYLKQQDLARKQQLADTAAEKVQGQQQTAIQNEIIRAQDKNSKLYEGPQQAALATLDPIIAQGRLTEKQTNDLTAWAQGLPTAWPKGSQVEATVATTTAGAGLKGAKTTTENATRQGKVDLLTSQKNVDDARAAYLNASSGKAAAATDIAKQKLAQDWADKSEKHLETAQKGGDPNAIAAAQADVTKARAALKQFNTKAAPASVTLPTGAVPVGVTKHADGPLTTPDGKTYFAQGGKLYSVPQAAE